ncbi:MAG: hypothetical protein U9O06_09850 [Euryarchaeota archaeon]|nr:hypothetical protein [Euryarchaeota archaeon]
MDVQHYRNRVETAVLDAEYEPITDGSTDPFDPVWQKRTDDPTIGVTEDFVTVIDAEEFDPETLTETADEFRALVTDISPSEPGGMENRFGYLVCAVADPSEELIDSAIEEYTVADRRTSVFPLIYDLESEMLHHHPVPRLKGRGFYEKQKLDAESLFSL